LAVVVSSVRNTPVRHGDARGLREALIAGPGVGCNRFTVRRITLEPEGSTARTSFKGARVYYIVRGAVLLYHNAGGLDMLEPGSAAVIQPGEVHQLRNNGEKPVEVLEVSSQ
jgi:quercetin dioxygenase-like cupin family protein